MAPAEPAVPEKMSAWQYSKRGGGAEALQLNESAPVPKPGRGEVLVKVSAASINPVDWKMQNGYIPILPLRYPATPGMDLAGDVVGLGPGVTKYKVGDSVFGSASPFKLGALAQYAVLTAAGSAPRPASIPPEVAAALPIAGRTALQALRDFAGLPLPATPDADTKNDYSGRVLVANASGGVGHLAVQLAKMTGAHVTATVGARNFDFARKLGADELLDYKTEAGQRLSASADTPLPSSDLYNAVVDGTHGLSVATVDRVLRPDGKWLHLTPPPSIMALGLWRCVAFRPKKVHSILMEAKGSDLEILAKMVVEEKLKVTLDATVPFEKVRDAWARSMEGHVVGKVVVKMD
ncbi:hypothetical protein CLOP_g22574 [Closterium sp. NIES-67]|nr:hypothetical protein CLOP_g22574 [Closterium sp. NIES-67]